MRDSRYKPINKKRDYLVNREIRTRKVCVITEDGQNLGSMDTRDALELAQNRNLDLVVISNKEGEESPVAKIMDFGKFLYEKKKKSHEAKKNQKIIQIKEIKMRPNIDVQDYRIKLKKAVDFLCKGKKVKFTLQFRGREMIMMNKLGTDFFKRIHDDLLQYDLGGTLIEEKDSRGRPFWSKIMYVK